MAESKRYCRGGRKGRKVAPSQGEPMLSQFQSQPLYLPAPSVHEDIYATNLVLSSLRLPFQAPLTRYQTSKKGIRERKFPLPFLPYLEPLYWRPIRRTGKHKIQSRPLRRGLLIWEDKGVYDFSHLLCRSGTTCSAILDCTTSSIMQTSRLLTSFSDHHNETSLAGHVCTEMRLPHIELVSLSVHGTPTRWIYALEKSSWDAYMLNSSVTSGSPFCYKNKGTTIVQCKLISVSIIIIIQQRPATGDFSYPADPEAESVLLYLVLNHHPAKTLSNGCFTEGAFMVVPQYASKWNLDVTTQEGCVMFMAIVNDVKEMVKELSSSICYQTVHTPRLVLGDCLGWCWWGRFVAGNTYQDVRELETGNLPKLGLYLNIRGKREEISNCAGKRYIKNSSHFSILLRTFSLSTSQVKDTSSLNHARGNLGFLNT
ncbi:uncharacterized protein EV420DRAFT_882564 [Desarmillaria tabescens]|uniref:Uncharacterized protein n=1 Tax=Armillaria tabescens TaxID=1929756 RepID=A0AA39JQI4_ARMTA|nr:uncharacterized protein EV420DRAFT_882564 [Desarmillaria tabescens]KAK0446948.1 hypothetical protein EV420DRAFT_882564 [Desarmillaria tabescens]